MKGNRRCPFCSGQIPAASTWCRNCGRNLPEKEESKTRHSYEIVPDGPKFGIARNGDLLLRGLDLEAAKVLLAALANKKPQKVGIKRAGSLRNTGKDPGKKAKG